jgi:hypothetical protein
MVLRAFREPGEDNFLTVGIPDPDTNGHPRLLGAVMMQINPAHPSRIWSWIEGDIYDVGPALNPSLEGEEAEFCCQVWRDTHERALARDREEMRELSGRIHHTENLLEGRS